jgi:putative zinc finger/helix-turn-helix YgiT family protein
MTEICVSCEVGTAHEIVNDREVIVNGKSFPLAGDRHMRCDTCHEEYYTDDQSREASRKVADVRRRDEGLLTGAEIQRVRQSLCLSQAQLESALGVSAKTLVRWELGTAVQSKAMDDVFRLIALDPDNLRLLVRVRQATLTSIVEQKLSPQDDIQVGELKQAVYAGLERANVALPLDAITCSVVEAIITHKRERLERSVTALGAAS